MQNKEEILAIPQATTEQKPSTAETIIQLLSQEWPLSLKSLHYKINKQQGKQTTFQATHKTLKKLERNGILIKNNGHYQLRPEWMNQLMQFVKETRQKYRMKTQHRIIFSTNAVQREKN